MQFLFNVWLFISLLFEWRSLRPNNPSMRRISSCQYLITVLLQECDEVVFQGFNSITSKHYIYCDDFTPLPTHNRGHMGFSDVDEGCKEGLTSENSRHLIPGPPGSHVSTVSGVLTSKASLETEMSSPLGVQFQQVRRRSLFVCTGLLQAKNRELGKVRLPMLQIKGAKLEKDKLRWHTTDLQSKHTPAHTLFISAPVSTQIWMSCCCQRWVKGSLWSFYLFIMCNFCTKYWWRWTQIFYPF